MGDFDEAVRRLRELGLFCPKCDAVNRPTASPTIELDAHGRASCNQCGYGWTPPKETP